MGLFSKTTFLTALSTKAGFLGDIIVGEEVFWIHGLFKFSSGLLWTSGAAHLQPFNGDLASTRGVQLIGATINFHGVGSISVNLI